LAEPSAQDELLLIKRKKKKRGRNKVQRQRARILRLVGHAAAKWTTTMLRSSTYCGHHRRLRRVEWKFK
jgi:hypothetical protein